MWVPDIVQKLGQDCRQITDSVLQVTTLQLILLLKINIKIVFLLMHLLSMKCKIAQWLLAFNTELNQQFLYVMSPKKRKKIVDFSRILIIITQQLITVGYILSIHLW